MDFGMLYPTAQNNLINKWDVLKKKIMQYITLKIKDTHNMDLFRKAMAHSVQHNG